MNSIETLQQLKPQYVPSPGVCHELQNITMVNLIGPLVVGKSTCMDNVVELDGRFARSRGFTTRDPRQNEASTEYRFLPHTEAGLATIADKAEKGQLVQFTVHPETGKVYGSEIEDYHKPIVLLDTMASAMDDIRRTPFQRRVEVALTTHPQAWVRRIMRRNMDVKEYHQRLREGKQSLEWSLEQGDDIMWLISGRSQNRYRAAEALIEMVDGTRESEARGRAMGEKLLATITRLHAAELV